MGYDAVAIRKMGVDPRSWDWFNRDYRKYEPSPITRERVLTSTTKRSWTRFIPPVIIAAGYVMCWVATMPQPILGLIIAFLFLFPVALFQAENTVVKGMGFAIAFVIAALTASLSLLALVLGLGGSIGVIVLFKNAMEPEETEVNIVYPDVLPTPSQRIFGTPGKVADAYEKYGQEAVDAGVAGEKNTAVLLELLMKIPGTTVYHGLRFPGSGHADVDHAVSHGNLVFLIDSKMFRWGEYEWSHTGQGDEIVRADGYGRGKRNHMDDAAEKYRAILGPGVGVVPLILMHGRNVKVSKNRKSSRGVMMLTANDAMRCIGDSLSEAMDQWCDNDAVRTTLVNNLK